jgi:hypothetical protein
MRRNTFSDSEHTRRNSQRPDGESMTAGDLPNRLMTAFDVAAFIGCHEETVRRAYLRGLLTSQRFGVRGRRFHPADVRDWIKRGAPTRVSGTKGGAYGCSKDLQAERVSSEPTMRASLVVRCDAPG